MQKQAKKSTQKISIIFEINIKFTAVVAVHLLHVKVPRIYRTKVLAKAKVPVAGKRAHTQRGIDKILLATEDEMKGRSGDSL